METQKTSNSQNDLEKEIHKFLARLTKGKREWSQNN